MSGMMLLMSMAVTVEGIIQYVKSIVKMFTQHELKTGLTQLGAMVLSVLLCFASGVDLYTDLGVQFSLPWLGTALTGVFASRGANYLSAFIGKIQTPAQK
jgi:hypothetical protein